MARVPDNRTIEPAAESAGIRQVAVVGTGVIGSSWATAFLGRGFEVVATDPAPGAEIALRRGGGCPLASLDPARLGGGRESGPSAL